MGTRLLGDRQKRRPATGVVDEWRKPDDGAVWQRGDARLQVQRAGDGDGEDPHALRAERICELLCPRGIRPGALADPDDARTFEHVAPIKAAGRLDPGDPVTERGER